jgi:hypothetical protein
MRKIKQRNNKQTLPFFGMTNFYTVLVYTFRELYGDNVIIGHVQRRMTELLMNCDGLEGI